jgi:hypothetical protein
LFLSHDLTPSDLSSQNVLKCSINVLSDMTSAL